MPGAGRPNDLMGPRKRHPQVALSMVVSPRNISENKNAHFAGPSQSHSADFVAGVNGRITCSASDVALMLIIERLARKASPVPDAVLHITMLPGR